MRKTLDEYKNNIGRPAVVSLAEVFRQNIAVRIFIEKRRDFAHKLFLREKTLVLDNLLNNIFISSAVLYFIQIFGGLTSEVSQFVAVAIVLHFRWIVVYICIKSMMKSAEYQACKHKAKHSNSFWKHSFCQQQGHDIQQNSNNKRQNIQEIKTSRRIDDADEILWRINENNLIQRNEAVVEIENKSEV